MLYIMFLMGILRISLTKWMNSGKQPDFKLSDEDKMAENNEK